MNIFTKIVDVLRKILFYLFLIMVALFFVGVLEKRNRKEKKIRTKLKYFTPSIKEGFFGNTVTWKLRDKSLTDEQLDNL